MLLVIDRQWSLKYPRFDWFKIKFLKSTEICARFQKFASILDIQKRSILYTTSFDTHLQSLMMLSFTFRYQFFRIRPISGYSVLGNHHPRVPNLPRDCGRRSTMNDKRMVMVWCIYWILKCNHKSLKMINFVQL